MKKTKAELLALDVSRSESPFSNTKPQAKRNGKNERL
jgi:hypothetical protein